eukprot:gene22769-22764_t
MMVRLIDWGATMRAWICGVIAAGALIAAGAPAMAAPLRLEATDGRCTFGVNNGQIGASNYKCSKLTVSQDAKSGDVTLRFEFTDGLVVELTGSGMQVNPTWMMMGIGKMAWTNPGGTPMQDLRNPADSPRDQLIGQCAVSLQENGTRIWEVYCQLNTAIGAVKAEYKVPKGHTRTLGVAGGVNKRLAIVLAAVAAAAIGGVWASILTVDPLKLKEAWQVWPWLGLYAFPALAAIVSLFLIPLYFMILRPAGHKDAAAPVFAVFGAATFAMVAGLLLVSGPRALRDYDVFQLEDGYVRATLKDINAVESGLAKTGIPVLTVAGGGDPLVRAQGIAAARD